MRAHALVELITSVKQREMSKQDGMNIITQTKTLSLLNTLDNSLSMLLNGRYCQRPPNNTRMRKTLEAYLIAIKRPPLNDQLYNNLVLFKNGIT